MRGVIVTVVVLTTFVAFRAGSRWRRNKGTWGDWRIARDKERGLRKARWRTLRMAIGGMVILVIYLLLTGWLSITLTPRKPQPTCSPTQHASCPPSPKPVAS